jgi:hypothetical protein
MFSYGTKLYVTTPITFTGFPANRVGENFDLHAANRRGGTKQRMAAYRLAPREQHFHLRR